MAPPPPLAADSTTRAPAGEVTFLGWRQPGAQTLLSILSDRSLAQHAASRVFAPLTMATNGTASPLATVSTTRAPAGE